jgi:hypothetical protein
MYSARRTSAPLDKQLRCVLLGIVVRIARTVSAVSTPHYSVLLIKLTAFIHPGS